MNKKELIEYLNFNMPDFEGNTEEREIKTALYIYIQLGKMKSFDEKYYLGNSKMRQKAVERSKRESRNLDEIANKKKITCITLSKLYEYILYEFGINSIISEPERKDPHVYNIIYTENKKIRADLQQDLTNIQTKSKLQNFEILSHKENKIEKSENDESLTQMLIEVGYIKDKNDYREKKLKNIREKIKGKDANEALEIILNEKDIYENETELQISELDKYYKAVLQKLIPTFYSKKVHFLDCYKEDENGERNYTACIFSKEKEDLRVYLFLKRKQRFLKVELDKLIELENGGLVLGAMRKGDGVQKLRKHINSYIKTKKENEGIEK